MHLSKTGDVADRRARRRAWPAAALVRAAAPVRRRRGGDCDDRGNRQRPRAGRQAAPRAAPSIWPCASCRERQREAMFEVYSFCKAVDDIADGDAPRPGGWRSSPNGASASPRSMPAGAGAASRRWRAPSRRFGLRREDFLTVIDGMEMDAVEDIRAPSFEQLDLYCDRVASAVGRLSVRVFGLEGQATACALALSSRARLAAHQYPARHRRGRRASAGSICRARRCGPPASTAAIRNSWSSIRASASPAKSWSTRAREHFREADAIMARCPRRLVRAPRDDGSGLSADAGRDDRCAAGRWPRTRVHVSRSHLMKIALRHAIL